MRVLKYSHGLLIAILLLGLPEAQSRRPINTTIPAGSVPSFAGNPQHTANYQPTVPNLKGIRWSASIDDNNGDFAHYGAPLVTAGNTVLAPVKIPVPGPSPAANGFRIDAFDGVSGATKYSLATDYVLPTFNWIPVYNPCITTGAFGTRLYYAGPGGTVYHIDNPDSVGHGSPVQEVFYTTLANYVANASAFNSTIFINTPLTPDSSGNIYFGFRVQGTAPAPLNTTESGFARVDANGNGAYVLAGTAANDASVTLDSHNSAPALSHDEATVYVVAKSADGATSYLLGLDSATLAQKYRVVLLDPHSGMPADITDNSTASPTVAPDNDVYFGILGNPNNGFRGWLLRFSSDLATEKIPGAFGWDYTPAIVPASMVPSYQGGSSYLLFCKYNNYAFSDGDGVNRVALLDPNAIQLDPHSSAVGFVEMREVQTLIGPTPDGPQDPQLPYKTREWCINTAAVNPATSSILVPNEDGRLYRWNVATNSFAEAVTLTAGIGEPYVPSLIGPDGTVFTLNGGTLFALGPLAGVNVALATTAPDVRTFVASQSVAFTATVSNPAPGPTPTGTVTFVDFTYQDLNPITTTLGTVILDANGQASLTTSNLEAGNGFLGSHLITATYNGDANFPSGSARLMQKVHALASSTILDSAPNPSSPGESVSFTATVSGGPSTPTGMVTFEEGSTSLAQIPLSNGTASFDTAPLAPGDHIVTATYQSDTVFALSSDSRTQSVAAPSPTPSSTPSPSATPSATATATATPTATPVSTATATPTATATSTPTATPVFTATATPTATATSTPTATPASTATATATATGTSTPAATPVSTATATPAATATSTPTATPVSTATAIPTATATSTPTATPTVTPAATPTTAPSATPKGVPSPTPTATPAQPINFSTRMRVQTGDNVGIGGFIIRGTTPKHVLVRAIGPSLRQSGITNPLADPRLALFASGPSPLAVNNNWRDTQEQAIKDTGIPPQNDLESAIDTTLSPGNYTA